MTLSERIAGYAYRYWMRKHMTEWPSVRQTARALGIRQSDIGDEEHSGDFCTAQYNCDPPQPFGDHDVQAMTPAVSAAWEQYYAGAR
jgi:hypothetical protein